MEEDEEMSDAGGAPAEQTQDSVHAEDVPPAPEDVDPSGPRLVPDPVAETLVLKAGVLDDSQVPCSSRAAFSAPAEELPSVEPAVPVDAAASAASAPVDAAASVEAAVAAAASADEAVTDDTAAGLMDSMLETAIPEDTIPAPMDAEGLADATDEGDSTRAAPVVEASSAVTTAPVKEASLADRAPLADSTEPVGGASPADRMALLDGASPAQTTASMVGASPADMSSVDGGSPAVAVDSVASVEAAVLADVSTPADTTAADATVSPTPAASVASAVSVDVAVQAATAPTVDGTSVGAEAKEAEEAAVVESGRGGRKKRGRPTASLRHRPRAPPKKKEEEDVCFICFDGGNLVLCDRRGCPKAYHPQCINRDEAFFRSKGRWNCGWHICSKCERASQYMCYTCTYSLCKGCMKEAGFLCVRGNKGLCETCMRTVMLIEHNGQTDNGMPAVDFDDRTSWEYLFKEYWLDLKRRLSLTSDELARARNPLKGSGILSRNGESSDELFDVNAEMGSSSDSSFEHLEASSSTKRGRKRSKSFVVKESASTAKHEAGAARQSIPEGSEWASNELVEFVSHMKGGNKSALSQFDVQALLLEYIKRNNLRDPRKKSQIICDSRLQSLFGKARVGHIEMLKLLESHFLVKENPPPFEDDSQGGMLDSDVIQMDADGNSDSLKAVSDKRRKTRKRIDERGHQTNPDDYAAIDVHNIGLIYLRRNLMEDLIDDVEKFHDVVVGSFVRIRISGSGQKQDMYRLVQVVGTGKAAEMYKTGKKTTYFTLEILNLNKTEVISIDIISNQEFTEEECKRLRQSIKCGFIRRLTVGEVQEKARALQAVRVNDWFETELLRLNHLRDRASEKGRKKEHRECVEKIQLLSTPEERSRRLKEIPEVHADPNMDPDYETDEDDGGLDEKKQENYMRSRDAGISRKGRDPLSPVKGVPSSNDSWSAAWNPSRNIATKGVGWDKGDATVTGERISDSWNQGRDSSHPSGWEVNAALGNSARSSQVANRSSQPSVVDAASAALPAGTVAPSGVSETDKLWHYQDPSGKIQGPFSMMQLRKWSKTGFFPENLRIWKLSEKQEDSILLTDALIGKFQKEQTQWPPQPQQRTSSQTQTVSAVSDNSTWTDKHQSGNSTVAAVNSKERWVGGSSISWDSSKGSNAWSSQSQSHSPSLTLSGQSYQLSSHQGREVQGGGDTSMWNSVQTQGQENITSGILQSSTWSTSGQSPSEGHKVQPERNSSKDWEILQGSRSEFSDPPSPTPKPSSAGWPVGQAAQNVWSPTSVQPVSSWGTTTVSGLNGASQQHVGTVSWSAGQPSPNMLPEGTGAEQGNRTDSMNLPTPTPKSMSSGAWPASPGTTVSSISIQQTSTGWSNPLAAGGNADQLSSSAVNESFKGAVVWGPQSPGLMKSSVDNISEGKQTTLPDVSSSSTHHPGMVVDFLSADTSQHGPHIVVTDQPHLVLHTGVDSEKKSQALVPAVADSALSVDGQASNPPSVVVSSLPPSQTTEVNWHALAPLASAEFLQTNLQNQAAFGFSESIQTPSTTASILSQEGWGPNWNVVTNSTINNSQANTSALLSGNPWNSSGPVMENSIPMINSARVAGGVAGAAENRNTLWDSNQCWLPMQANANVAYGAAAPQGNSNLGWGIAPQTANAGWGTSVHGNANMGWDPSTGNSGVWAGNQQAHVGERFSSQGDRGFQAGDAGQGSGMPSWMRQSSGGGGGSSRGGPPRGGGQRVCKFHGSGYCKKGSACGYLHT